MELWRGTSGSGRTSIDLGSLAGLPCEMAISAIAQALTSQDGDSEKICAAMNHALVEALDGVAIFDPQQITDGVIVDTMICYLAESIFCKWLWILTRHGIKRILLQKPSMQKLNFES